MNTKLKTSKGITLIALVITIIVLLILAGVSIAMLTGENGILTQAQNSQRETEIGEEKEQIALAYNGAIAEKQSTDVTADDLNRNFGYNDAKATATGSNPITVTFTESGRKYEIDENGNITEAGSGTTPEEPETESTLGTVTGTETSNTTVQDTLGNKVVVPAGFKVVNPTDNVENGIVIEDVNHGATAGSQFVWIPVGTIHTSSGDKTITLGRYVFNSDGTINTELSKTEPTDQLKTSSTSSYYYTEGLKDSSTTNAHAKDITTFISKVNITGGYYIGRYEARDGDATEARTTSTSDTNQLVCAASNFVYNYVTQPQAARLSQGMYSDSNFESDLVNSYAWDTAVVFIQECSGDTDYSRQNSLNTSLANKGTNNLETKDQVCNVYDMASNCREWSTETSTYASYPCVYRGGTYFYSDYYAAYRSSNNTAYGDDLDAFRPLLYL